MYEQTHSRRPDYVVGLDLSLTGTGVATLGLNTGHTHLALVASGPVAGDGLAPVIDRLSFLLNGIARETPSGRALVVVEAPSHGSRNGKAHERAGLWWRTVTYLHGRGHLIAQASPRTRSKYAAGHRPVAKHGSGPNKREVVAALAAEHPHLNLANDNVADAFALACMGARFLGAPIDPSTRQRAEAVAAVRWPLTLSEGTPS